MSAYLKNRKIKEFGKVPVEDIEQYWVSFEEGLPEIELVHADEFALRSEEPNNDEQSYFVQSIKGLQSEMMKKMLAHNIKWGDVVPTMDWVMESIKQVRDRLNNSLFGVKDWETELRVSHCVKVIEEQGKKVEFKQELNPLEKYVVDGLMERDVLLCEGKRGMNTEFSLQKVCESIFDLQIQALEAYTGFPQIDWRLDTVEGAIHRLDAAKELEKKPDETPTVEANEASVGSDIAGESVSGGEAESVSGAESTEKTQ